MIAGATFTTITEKMSFIGIGQFSSYKTIFYHMLNNCYPTHITSYLLNYNIPVHYLGATRKIKAMHHWTHLHEHIIDVF